MHASTSNNQRKSLEELSYATTSETMMLKNQTSEIAALYAKLAAAEERQAIEKQAVKKAKAKYDRAYAARDDVVEQIGEALIRQWGANPDWPTLLAENKPGGMVLYQALEQYLARIGLYCPGGLWADNREYIVGLSINSCAFQAIDRIAKAITYIVPHIKKIKGGWARFMVAHHDTSNSAWELHYLPNSNRVRLKQLIYSIEHQVLEFTNLDLALQYVRQNLWREDIIDADSSLELLAIE